MKNSKRSLSESQNTRKIRKILHEESRMVPSTNSDSDTEEVDLRKDIHPLGHYINNREEMIEQMFSIIKGTKLRKMLPPTLKDLPLDELKADCLIHLLGMSTKRILAIIEGREINSSSDSETDSDSPTHDKKATALPKPLVIKQEGCSDISDNSEEVVLINSDFDDELDIKSNLKKKSDDSKTSKRSKKLKTKKKELIGSPSKNVPDKKQVLNEHKNTCSDDSDIQIESPKKEKTLLEILELEMRARAIRAMLNKDGSEVENKDTTKESTNNLLIDIENKPNSPENVSQNTSSAVKPAKSYRKNNQKSDDVIIITPEVLTIDLTDENPSQEKQTAESESLVEKINEVVNDISMLPHKDPNISLECNTSTENNKGIKSNETHSEVKINKNTNHVEQKRSWAQRWLESKEVKKVVSTSKICGNIRKKIKNAKLAKEKSVNSDNITTPAEANNKIQGSVDEYQLLSKSKQVNSMEIGQDNSISTDEQVQDVTSTKNETVLPIKLLGGADTDSSESTSLLGSNDRVINSCKCDTRQENDEKMSCTIDSNDKINNNPGNEDMEDKEFQSGSPLQTTSELVSHIETSGTDSLKSKQTNKNDEISQTDVEHSEDDISKTCNTSLCVTDGLEADLMETDTGAIAMTCDEMDSDNPNLNLPQLNNTEEVSEICPEPETLEINITEEDREIDGIEDEKIEDNTKNTNSVESECIEID